MNSRVLYETAINSMTEMLDDTIRGFKCAHKVMHNYYRSQPLFCIVSPELDLLKKVSYSSNYQARNTLAELGKNLCILFEHCVAERDCKSDVDFYELSDEGKRGYYFSMSEEYMPDLDEAVAKGMTSHIVVVLKDNCISLPPNSQKYLRYSHKGITKIITLKDFFDGIHPGEYEIFQEYIGRFNYDAEKMLGLTVSPIPTKKELQKKWDKIKQEFDSLFYKQFLAPTFDLDEISELKKYFYSNGILSILSTPFVDSFISSEWYFDLMKSTDGEMEQTAIVAGYLKSIEQLLFALMLSRCDSLQFKLRDKTDNRKLVPLSITNKSSVLSMAGSLLESIDCNYGKKQKLDFVYINSTIGRKTQDFLHDFFKNTRNGYLHKDNIYTLKEIEEIRAKVYCAYFLLGSAFLFDAEKVKSTCILITESDCISK